MPVYQTTLITGLLGTSWSLSSPGADEVPRDRYEPLGALGDPKNPSEPPGALSENILKLVYHIFNPEPECQRIHFSICACHC